MLIFVFLLILGTVQGATVVTKYYSGDVGCTRTPSLIFVTQASTCTPSMCTNLNAQAGRTIECPSGAFSYPTGWIYAETWTTSNACGGTPDAVLSTPNNTCSGFWPGATFTMSCQNTLIYDCGISTQTCGACPSKPFVKTGACTSGNPTTNFAISSYKLDCKSFGNFLFPAFSLLLLLITF